MNLLSTQDLNDCVYQALLEESERHSFKVPLLRNKAPWTWAKRYYHTNFAYWVSGRWA